MPITLLGKSTLTVPKVHNTFGESHLYILRIGINEDSVASMMIGHNHQWTIPRSFHVSPFNDRSGTYTIAIKSPSHAPQAPLASRPGDTPKPMVSIRLHTTDGQLKLVAIIRPIKATPLTALSVISHLTQYPIALFMSMPRILYQAFILHYHKRLDVYMRPQPIAGVDSGGIKWLRESFLERYARKRIYSFLTLRAKELGIQITLHPDDIALNPKKFTCAGDAFEKPVPEEIKIAYSAPKFFTLLFTSPTARHALLLSTSEPYPIFSTDNTELFLRIFESEEARPISPLSSYVGRLRASPIPPALSLVVPMPRFHFLREATYRDLLVLFLISAVGKLERWVFKLTHARVVTGQEEWLAWDRIAAAVQENSTHAAVNQETNGIGSVLRPVGTF